MVWFFGVVVVMYLLFVLVEWFVWMTYVVGVLNLVLLFNRTFSFNVEKQSKNNLSFVLKRNQNGGRSRI